MLSFFFFQAEDGIRDLVRSRGLGDVYKRQVRTTRTLPCRPGDGERIVGGRLDLTPRANQDADLSLIHL